MAEEQKVGADSAQQNAAAEQDVKNLLAELKAEEAGEADGIEKSTETEGKPSASSDADKKEEERIIAAANKLGQEAESNEKSKDASLPQKGRGQSTRGRGGKRVNYSDNIKFDATSLKETSDPVEIRKQVEFYFSDSNLPMDKFLLSKVGGSENRPVELSLLHSFKRMRRFQPFSAVVDALKDSETLQLTDDNKCVQRKVPLPENITELPNTSAVKLFEDKALNTSIYAKGFGDEEPSTQFDIEAFFTPYGPTNAVRLRRTHDKIFKGSVFVEFDSEEAQKSFLALDPKPKWKGTELLIKSKREYCDEKLKEIEAGRLKPSERFRGRGHRGRGRGRGRGGNQKSDRDWRDRRGDEQKRGFKDNRDDKNGRQQPEKDARGVPVIQTSANNVEGNGQQNGGSAGQKRAREEDTNGNGSNKQDDRPAKKVDV
ncbi:hypothetical protein FQN57_003851 [Myotisia sp. PD_48]|nr:hypothetical protein FQN57_003851 [Myotisia sp. PD_48]